MRRPVALAAVLWVVLGVVVWNVVFDAYVREGALEYLRRQTRYDQGLGPPATIDAIMRPAIADGFRRATLWAVAVWGFGLTLLAIASRIDRPGLAGGDAHAPAGSPQT